MELSSTVSTPSFFVKISQIIGNEKISLGPIDTHKHITLHLGTKSKRIDIHIKDEFEQDEKKRYDQLIVVSYFELKRLYILTKDEIKEQISLSLSSTINKGKLRKNKCILNPILKNYNSDILKVNKERTRFKLKKSINTSVIDSLFIDIDNIHTDTEIHFVYRIKNGNLIKNGIIFKRFDKQTNNSYIYLSERQKKILRNNLTKILIDNIEKVKTINTARFFEQINS